MLQDGILRSKSSELVGLSNSQQDIHLPKPIWAGLVFQKKKTDQVLEGSAEIAILHNQEKLSVSCNVCLFDNCFG